MLQPAEDYASLVRHFRWALPERYNIGTDVVDRHPADATALIHEQADGTVRRYSFGEIRQLSDRFANALRGLGVGRGERVAILLPQSPEAAIAHIAIYKLGAIALPLFTLFGPEALQYRLADSAARVVLTGADKLETLQALRAELPALREVIVTGERAPRGLHAFDALLRQAAEGFQAEATAPDDPALIVYTSGTTGNPKGALHGHRVLLGHLPGVELPHDFFPQPEDLFWTPADWAWVGGLLDVLLPAWHHGVPVLARRMHKFDPEEAFHLMAKHRVRNSFLPPTALKLMRQVPQPKSRHAYALRSIGSGGETLGEELLEWGRQTFDLTINEFYGQTECNLIVGNCATLMPPRPGSMGRAIPGHEVAIIDHQGRPLADGETGLIAVRAPDPVMFLGYWNRPEATREKYIGEWLLTGDTGSRDDDGYFWFKGRADDVITSAGYRIGPAEIEDCLLGHPAVALAAVVGKPDELRTEIVKAFIVPGSGVRADQALASEIQAWVKQRLAAYEYPREIEFVDSLPMTTTGKIIRRELKQREIERSRGKDA
ncbi:acyl-CoA synthetase [Alkalilimnicola sp. S0819]|uniref:acyl-CoA synthetase n=1 Tax=Alkalilimnicola sp. S0819 TaxID=2613922 RepID=UPI0012621F4C|nr:acyl-CoA synthetase [Alkalilimnicola sp. S0819]KAB7628275.1 AMP-binding protein [Alkalilimnicola sp. S0819]MPQ15171.1 AMP-binding protein [Alkalilimnicola sp. S0819]